MVKSHGLAVGALLAWALCAAQPAMAQDPVDGVCQDDVRNTCTAGTPNDDAVPDSSSAYLWRCDGLHGGQNSRICFVRREDVVDGVCDESVRNGCSAGTPNPAAYPDEPVTYQWRCDGQGGGQNSRRCARWFSVDGACDESVRNGCSAGTANDDAFPDTSTEYAWRCDGWNAGANSARCSRHVPVNGVCDDSARNACSAGTPNDDAFADTSNAYLWRCDGLHGGSNSDKCHVFKPVNGVCDDSVRNGCAAGTPNDDAFPDAGSGGFVWRCDGEHGGRNSEKCFVRSVNGVCDDGVRNSCSAGTPNDDAFADTSNAYLWRCDGLHGGTNSDKCHMFIPVNGVCDESVRNGCSAGTANDDAVPDSANAHLWRCDGEHGGRHSEKCLKYIAVDGVCDESVRNGCSAGTANDDAIADTSSAYLWRCDGLHGGANSESCSKAMAVDGGWSDWSACSATSCGTGGTQTRTCNNPAPAGGGQDCLKLDGTRGASETRACTGNSPVNGGWSSWGSCSAASCGATGTQTRTCTNPAPGCGGQPCSGPSSRSCTANTRVDGGWSAWSVCSASACGTSGTQTRTCNSPSPACGGSACTGAASRSCTGNSPRDGAWRTGPWGGWSKCRGASDDCTQTRSRTVTCAAPGCGGAACDDSAKPRASESRSCTCPPQSCPATSLSWGSSCSSPVSSTPTGTAVTLSDPDSCRTGSATFQCSSGGSWGSATNASCTVSDPENGECSPTGCLVGTRRNLLGGGWECLGRCGGTTDRCPPPPPSSCPGQSVSWDSCSSRVGTTDAGTAVTVSDPDSCRSGSATFQCSSGGSWGGATNTSCTVSPAQDGACRGTGCAVGERRGQQCVGVCGGATVNCPTLPLFTVSVSVSVSGNTATASAVVSGGTAPYSYSWRVSGGRISGPSNGSSIAISYPRGQARYPNATVTVTDSTGATVSGHSF